MSVEPLVAAAAGEDQPAPAGADRAAPGHHHRAAAAGHPPGRDRSVRCAADQPRHAARGDAATATGRPDLATGDRGRLSVRHLDAKEIRDIFDVRAALESLAARELCALPDRAGAVAILRKAVDGDGALGGVQPGGPHRGRPEVPPHHVPTDGQRDAAAPWSSLEGSIRMSIMFAGVDRAIKNMDVKRHSGHRRRDRNR